jgi:hypothetical protein
MTNRDRDEGPIEPPGDEDVGGEASDVAGLLERVTLELFEVPTATRPRDPVERLGIGKTTA